MTRPSRIPGRAMSEVYLCAPVTKSRPFALGAEDGSQLSSAQAGSVEGSSRIVSVNCLPLISSAYVIWRLEPACRIRPLSAASSASGTRHFRPARRISTARALAAAFAELHPHLGRGAATEGSHVIRSQFGVSHDHLHRRKRYPKLFCDLLRKRRTHVLADFYFAGESGDLSVVTDVQPRIKSFWSFWPRFNSGSGFLRRRVEGLPRPQPDLHPAA